MKRRGQRKACQDQTLFRDESAAIELGGIFGRTACFIESFELPDNWIRFVEQYKHPSTPSYS